MAKLYFVTRIVDLIMWREKKVGHPFGGRARTTDALRPHRLSCSYDDIPRVTRLMLANACGIE